MEFQLNRSFFRNFLIGCLWAPFFISCSTSQQRDVTIKEIDTTVDNPNVDSELTLLMRKIYEDADSIKSSIKVGNGNITVEFIEELELAHKAIPSNPKHANPTFTAFNELIITEAKSLRSASENIEEGFNKLVNRCVDCHKTFCPGPIPRIKKLKIK